MSQKERDPGLPELNSVAMQIAFLETEFEALVALAGTQDTAWSDRLRAEIERLADEIQQGGEEIIRRLGQLSEG